MVWQCHKDYLHCNLLFYNHPHYDCVMVNTADGAIFAQLVFIFIIFIHDTPYPIALVQAFDQQIGLDAFTRKKDSDLGLWRVQQCKKTNIEFIFARSIICGALIFPACDIEQDSVVCDVVDSDMMLRVEQLKEKEQNK